MPSASCAACASTDAAAHTPRSGRSFGRPQPLGSQSQSPDECRQDPSHEPAPEPAHDDVLRVKCGAPANDRTAIGGGRKFDLGMVGAQREAGKGPIAYSPVGNDLDDFLARPRQLAAEHANCADAVGLVLAGPFQLK